MVTRLLPLHPSASVERNGIHRCINQAGHVDRSNKDSRNGHGKEKGKKCSEMEEFCGEEKNREAK